MDLSPVTVTSAVQALIKAGTVYIDQDIREKIFSEHSRARASG